MTATVHDISGRIHRLTWWTHPHAPAELAATIETAIVEHEHGAWIEVTWLYRDADATAVHSFVDDAVHHLERRDTWLHDPQHARDLYTDCGLGDEQVEADREDQLFHDLIREWVNSHAASRP